MEGKTCSNCSKMYEAMSSLESDFKNEREYNNELENQICSLRIQIEDMGGRDHLEF